MTSDSETQDHDQPSFKCRRCRQFLFSNASILPSLTADSESNTNRPGFAIGNHTAPKLGHEQPRADVLWYISDDAIPPWIQTAIEEAQWTKGKLNCPKCRGRLGSFDFLTPSIQHRANRQQAWSCIQINGSRVDRETSQSLLAWLRRGNPPGVNQVKGQTSSDGSLGAESMLNGTGRFEHNDGALPAGCWYLNRDEIDTRALSHTPDKIDPNLCLKESWSKDTQNPFEMDQRQSSKETMKAPNVEPASRTSNRFKNFTIREPSRAQANREVSRTLPSEGDLQSSEQLLESSQAGLEPGSQDLDHSWKAPRASCRNSVDETIQFGFRTRKQDSKTKPSGIREVSNLTIWNDHEADAILTTCSITTETSEDTAMSKPLPKDSGSSFLHDHQGLYNSHLPAPDLDSQNRPIKTQYSNTDSQSEQADSAPAEILVTETASSPETWQGVLDELLLDLDRERGGALTWALRGQDDISQHEDEMDTDNHQDVSFYTSSWMGNADDSWPLEASNHANTQGTSACLQRAVQRAQRRERNKRKSAQRKLRRRERWLVDKETEEQELLTEEQNLDRDPGKLLSLLGTPETSGSTRETLTCPVCLDLYLNPHRCLPCQHVFCEPCLRHLAHTAQTRVATPCPLCRAVIREAKSLDKLTAAIEESFPRLISLRKQAERKTLNKSYPLPVHPAPTSLASWISRTLVSNNRNGLRHWRGRGRQEQIAVGLIRTMAWRVGSVLLLTVALTLLSAGFLLVTINYS